MRMELPNYTTSSHTGKQLLAEWDDRQEINRLKSVYEDLVYVSKFDRNVRMRKTARLLLTKTEEQIEFLESQFDKKFGKIYD